MHGNQIALQFSHEEKKCLKFEVLSRKPVLKLATTKNISIFKHLIKTATFFV